MRNFNMNAIKDFWEDYVNSFVDTKVNLRNAKICRIDRMIGENLIILATDVDTGLQYEQKMHVLPAKLTKRLERIGCFYEIDNYRYIPTVDVKGRVINDYCKPLKSEDDTKSTIVLSRFSEDEDVARLARRMKNARNLTFVSRRPFEVMDSYVTYKYAILVGIKSANKQTQIYAIDIMDALCKKAEKTKAFSGYIDQQKANNVNFTFTCKDCTDLNFLDRSACLVVHAFFHDAGSTFRCDHMVGFYDNFAIFILNCLTGETTCDTLLKSFDLFFTIYKRFYIHT